ncbi:E3 SUMO-protein ligase PIAS2-like isoform X2 [Penaeus japonicus]|uniref:E3 SUMO-protein ligase PIAS2-like isoform X2 n=1 Tax=Penaeus japonicus TaxID=27405 RepID=UPI001C71350B|nr:E3 SUMO-protein ligase PIAS2-like isoform X2 [Penaeus japonicus]
MSWSWAPSNFNYPVPNNARQLAGRGIIQQPRQFPNIPLCDQIGLPVPTNARNRNDNVQQRNRPRVYYEPRRHFQPRHFPAQNYNGHRYRPQNRPLLSNPYSHNVRQVRSVQNCNYNNQPRIFQTNQPSNAPPPLPTTSREDLTHTHTHEVNSRWAVNWDWHHPENMNFVRAVTIKKIPFYDVLDTLLQNSIIRKGSEQMQFTFKFRLNPDQLENLHTDQSHQVQIRFCRLDTMREQPDYFPNSLQVAVNNDLLHLKGVHEVPKGPAEPIDITNLCFLSQQSTNEVQVRTLEECKMYVFLVKKLTSEDLIQRLKDEPHREPEITSQQIKEKLSQDTSIEDIAPTTLQCSLLCPLGRTRLKLPCRASTCKHLQCFDAATYIQMNELKPKWCCPVCRESAQYKNLEIDGYFLEVLKEKISDDTIVLLADGSWKPMTVAEQELKHIEESQEKMQSEENVTVPSTEKTINLESDDEACDEDYANEDDEESAVARALSSTVETITLSDDEPSNEESPQIRRTSFRFCSTPMSSQATSGAQYSKCDGDRLSSGPRTRGRMSLLLNASEISDASSAFDDSTCDQSSNVSDESFLPLSVSSLANSTIESTTRVLRSRTRRNYRE